MLFEDTIKEMGKWWLKHVLQRYTDTIAKSIGVGVVQTFLFQSSSIVTMITLGFVGAGIIGMYNGLGVVLGANIGTTLTPWLVYLLWFKINIEQYMLPLIGVAGLTLMIADQRSIWHKVAKFMVGFALLFLGLDYMKTSVETLAQVIDLSQYAHWWLIWFTLIGALLTTIMQTSTGVTIIALTALSSGLISLDMALGIVIGANIWSAISTGMMWFLTSSHWQSTKKQISISHMIFNWSTAFLVIVLFQPIKSLIISIVGADDPTLVLAIFHTTFNVILLAIWIPCLKWYSKQIMWWYVDHQSEHQFAISQINTTVSEEVIQALHTDMGYLLSLVVDYNRAVMGKLRPDSSVQTIELYMTIKQAETTLLSGMAHMSHTDHLDHELFDTLDTYDDLLLDMVASSKYLKDMIDHYENIIDSDWVNGRIFYECLHDMVHDLLQRSEDILHHPYEWDVLQELIDNLKNDINHDHETFGSLIAQHTNQTTPASTVSELIKTHHYTMLSCNRLIESLYHYKCSLNQSHYDQK